MTIAVAGGAVVLLLVGLYFVFRRHDPAQQEQRGRSGHLETPDAASPVETPSEPIVTRPFSESADPPTPIEPELDEKPLRLQVRIPEPTAFGFEIWNLAPRDAGFACYGIDLGTTANIRWPSSAVRGCSEAPIVLGTVRRSKDARTGGVAVIVEAQGQTVARGIVPGRLFMISGIAQWDGDFVNKEGVVEIETTIAASRLTVELDRHASGAFAGITIAPVELSRSKGRSPPGASWPGSGSSWPVAGTLATAFFDALVGNAIVDSEGTIIVHGIPGGFGVVDTISPSHPTKRLGSYVNVEPLNELTDFPFGDDQWASLPPTDGRVRYAAAGRLTFPSVRATVSAALDSEVVSGARLYCRLISGRSGRRAEIGYASMRDGPEDWSWSTERSPRPYIGSKVKFVLAGHGIEPVVVDGRLDPAAGPVELHLEPLTNAWDVRIAADIEGAAEVPMRIRFSIPCDSYLNRCHGSFVVLGGSHAVLEKRLRPGAGGFRSDMMMSFSVDTSLIQSKLTEIMSARSPQLSPSMPMVIEALTDRVVGRPRIRWTEDSAERVLSIEFRSRVSVHLGLEERSLGEFLDVYGLRNEFRAAMESVVGDVW